MLFPLLALPQEPPYRLVWQDEFSKDGLPDQASWGYEEGFVRNKELQFYRKENVWVEGGRLIIEGRRERIPNPAHDPASKDWRKERKEAEYTAGCVITRGKREFRFGRSEIRAKIVPQKGLWPAIWTLGTIGPWPKNGEVDLLEYYRDMILANTCWGNETWDSQKKPYGYFKAKDPQWADKFHVWRMDWDASWIRIYLDDELLNETDLSKTLNPDGTNPFHNPQYLLLNLAIGSNGGDPSGTKFPSRFEVDYVRVYQRG